MNKWLINFAGLLLFTMLMGNLHSQSIYHKGWIDFNKNGQKDIYEDPSQDIEKRVQC